MKRKLHITICFNSSGQDSIKANNKRVDKHNIDTKEKRTSQISVNCSTNLVEKFS